MTIIVGLVDERIPPCVERPGAHLETRMAKTRKDMASVVKRLARYPDPVPAELITIWQKQGRPVLSVTSGGKVQDFFIKPSVVAHMARQAIDLLHSSAK